MQTSAQLPVAPAPAKPGCFVWFPGDPCDQLIQQYNQAMAQRQLQEWQAQATTPLQKQIAEQQKKIAEQENQIQFLQIRLESQTVDALQSQARNQAFLDGMGAVIGAGLAFYATVAGFRRLARRSRSPKRETEPELCLSSEGHHAR